MSAKPNDDVDPPWLSQRLKDHGDTAEWIEDVARRRGITPEAMAAKVEEAIAEQEAREARRKAPAAAPPLPPAPESKPKPAERKNGRATYSKIGRELTAIEDRVFETERQYRAALYVIRRIAKKHRQWVSISRSELARELGCSGPTASKVLQSLVADGTLAHRPAERRWDARNRRGYADEYTFPRFTTT